MRVIIFIILTISVSFSIPIKNGNQRLVDNELLSTATNNLDMKIRLKRSVQKACEERTLCKLHARANHGNFFDTFQLYFVNKENAKEWDHKFANSPKDCDSMYPECDNVVKNIIPNNTNKKKELKEYDNRNNLRYEYSDEFYNYK